MKVFQEQLMEQARILSGVRRQASERLAADCTAYLRLLAMPHAQIEVRVESLDDFEQFRSTGADGVELLLRANAGEDAKPLAKIASGGELSRVLLAIKRVLVDKDEVACYIFDEVDTGIGGATATHVATMLREVSRSHQVLCITHLASIACYADAHYQVTKTVVDSRTQSHIVLLDASSRVAEIARMMGGATVTAKTLEHAAEMIAEVQGGAEQ